jgi:hypothetical protein
MYCRELFEHCAALPIPHGVSRESSPLPVHPAPETSTQSLTSNSAYSHLYHSKHFINSFLSHTSARLHPQTLSFDIHPFFAGGGVGYQTGYPSAAISAFCPPVSPLATSLTDTPSRKSFDYHSYAKRWGVGYACRSKGAPSSAIPHVMLPSTPEGLCSQDSERNIQPSRRTHFRFAQQLSLLLHFLGCSGSAMLPRAGHSRTRSEDRSTASGSCSWTHTSEGASK